MATKTLDKMTKAEARVAIAKDALLQLRKKKYIAQQNVYVIFDIYLKEDKAGNLLNLDKQLCQVLPQVGTCDVCARGALFLSAIRKFNNYSVKEFASNYGDAYGCHSRAMRTVERRYFTDKQLYMIEWAFEQQDIGRMDLTLTEEEESRCNNFEPYLRQDEERLEAILKNIIKNEGTFVP